MPNELSTLPHTQQGFCRKPSSVGASGGGFFVLCVLRVPAWSAVWPMGAPGVQAWDDDGRLDQEVLGGGGRLVWFVRCVWKVCPGGLGGAGGGSPAVLTV